MKNYKKLAVFAILIFGLLLAGCTNEVAEVPTLQVTKTSDETKETSEITSTPVIQPRFTVQADIELQEPVTLLYKAYFEGESPVFVDQDGDLVAKAPVYIEELRADIPTTFLPDGVLVSQNGINEVDEFIDFALSPDGQQVLIDGNILPESVTLTDQAGNLVDISLPVRRVLSAYGPATAIIYTVDAEDRFVSASYLGARDPLGKAVMEKIDPRFSEIQGDDSFSQSEFNIEESAMLNPDLIIANARSSWLDAAAELDIPIFLVDPETLERLNEAVLLIGQIFGPHSTAQAEAWVRYFNGIIGNIDDQVLNIPFEERVKVLFTGTEPLRVVSGDMFQSFIIESVGGISVSTDLEGYWKNVNLEKIAIWEPDVIIVPPYGGASVEAITDSQEWQIIEAVQEGRVYRMPKLVVPWDTPSPDAILGIVWMGERLYPEQIDLTCSNEAEFFYNTFYNYQITEEELGIICNRE